MAIPLDKIYVGMKVIPISKTAGGFDSMSYPVQHLFDTQGFITVTRIVHKEKIECDGDYFKPKDLKYYGRKD